MSTIKDFILENFSPEEIKDITEHGLVSGIGSALIYYKDTVAFHDKHESEIWDLLYDQANEQSLSILEFIAELNGHKDVGGIEQFKNLLAWFAAEHVCNLIINARE